MTTIWIDSQSFAHQTTNLTELATVAPNMFGGILVNMFDGQGSSFADSISYMALSNIRYPGGELSENGSIRIGVNGNLVAGLTGADQLKWMSGAEATWNYAYDLGFSELMNPRLLESNASTVSFSTALALANANGTSIEVILPTVRYTDFSNSLSSQQESSLLARCHSDVASFLHNLFIAGSYGVVPKEVILDIGNENLVWTTKFDGETLVAGQRFDPKAVEWGIGLYISAAKEMLDAAAEFRADHPDIKFEMALQVPYMNNQPGTTDPFDVFLTALKAMPPSELAQIDLLRFHPLDYSLSYANDLENWFTDDLKEYAKLINAARTTLGIEGVVQFCADAHTSNGNDEGGSGDGVPEQSLQAAASTVAAFSSMVEMGVTYASAWGVAINYREDVQASYYDPQTNVTHYTPRGEVLRQMAETLPGMTLVKTATMDTGRIGPVNLQAFGDGATYALFVSANDIAAEGQDVTINLGRLSHSITYAWAESITCAVGTSGEAVLWNPLRDVPGPEMGQTLVSFTGNTVSFHLNSDYQMVRLIISTDDAGTAPVLLIGDARLGSGITGDLLATGGGNDMVQGLSGSDTITGGGGNDALYGDRAIGVGPDAGDMIKGGSGDDKIYGGGGNDTLWGDSGADSLFGGSGDDVIYYDGISDFVDGGDGYDTLILTSTQTSTSKKVLALAAPVQVIKGIEYVVGSIGDDKITGNSGSDRINGGNGNDVIAGWAGSDTLSGSWGNDKIWAGNDNDTIYGGGGNDHLYGGSGSDVLIGSRGKDILNGGVGDDDFKFLDAISSGDSIADFGMTNGNHDRIMIDASGFNLNLSLGQLSSKNFYVTPSNMVHQADDYFIYRSSDRTLWVDTNGTLTGGLVLIADFVGSSAAPQAENIFLF